MDFQNTYKYVYTFNFLFVTFRVSNKKDYKMIERQITNTKKDSSGNIVLLCNPDEWWSPKSVKEVIYEIEESFYKYYVIADNLKVEVKVIAGSENKYLRTDPDKTTKNNLDELQDC